MFNHIRPPSRKMLTRFNRKGNNLGNSRNLNSRPTRERSGYVELSGYYVRKSILNKEDNYVARNIKFLDNEGRER